MIDLSTVIRRPPPIVEDWPASVPLQPLTRRTCLQPDPCRRDDEIRLRHLLTQGATLSRVAESFRDLGDRSRADRYFDQAERMLQEAVELAHTIERTGAAAHA